MFTQVMRERMPGALEHIYRWPSGSEMWIDVRAYPNADGRVACFWRDITEQKAATDALYKSQERQAFLLKVSDALRPLADPTDIQNAASRRLVESLEDLPAGFGAVEGDEIVVRADHSPRAGSIVGRYSVDDFGPTLARIYREGGAVVLRDAATDTMISDVERSLYASLNIAAHVTVATSSAGQPVISLGVQSEAPRDWSDADIASRMSQNGPGRR